MTHKPIWNTFFSIRFFKKVFYFLLLHTSRQFFIPPKIRPFFLKLCGIKFKDAKNVFIGTDVLFDIIENTTINIGQNVLITSGVKMICHYPIFTKNGVSEYDIGNITIEDNVFIGMNSLIVKPISIGKNAVVAAGSVVTKNVQANTIVAGNPAKVVSRLNFED